MPVVVVAVVAPVAAAEVPALFGAVVSLARVAAQVPASG